MDVLALANLSSAATKARPEGSGAHTRRLPTSSYLQCMQYAFALTVSFAWPSCPIIISASSLPGVQAQEEAAQAEYGDNGTRHKSPTLGQSSHTGSDDLSMSSASSDFSASESGANIPTRSRLDFLWKAGGDKQGKARP